MTEVETSRVLIKYSRHLWEIIPGKSVRGIDYVHDGREMLAVSFLLVDGSRKSIDLTRGSTFFIEMRISDVGNDHKVIPLT